jgi:hypothetical protein
MFAYVAAATVLLSYDERKVCETRAEGCHAERQGLCGCNSAIPSNMP